LHSHSLFPGRSHLRTVPVPVRKRKAVTVRADASEDAEFEKRLAGIKKAKGATPYGESRKESQKPEQSKPSTAKGTKEYDFAGETLHFEGAPHRGDLAFNVVLGATLLWLPLTAAAVGRAAFIKYRFTDRRISVITTAPWKNEQLDAAYQEVKEVRTVGRGLGLWGDMVVVLRNGDKIELRSLPKFLELKQYILDRRDALTGTGDSTAAAAARKARGFA
jgi:hypothetical protein